MAYAVPVIRYTIRFYFLFETPISKTYDLNLESETEKETPQTLTWSLIPITHVYYYPNPNWNSAVNDATTSNPLNSNTRERERVGGVSLCVYVLWCAKFSITLITIPLSTTQTASNTLNSSTRQSEREGERQRKVIFFRVFGSLPWCVASWIQIGVRCGAQSCCSNKSHYVPLLSRRENKQICSFFHRLRNQSFQSQLSRRRRRRWWRRGGGGGGGELWRAVRRSRWRRKTRGKNEDKNFVQFRLLLHIRIFGCRKSSKGYFWMEEIIQRFFVDAGSHPKVISGWRKAWKGYL